MAMELVFNLTQLRYSRGEIKITGFSIIYGSGYAGLASQLGQPESVARMIKPAYLAAMPGVNGKPLDDVKLQDGYTLLVMARGHAHSTVYRAIFSHSKFALLSAQLPYPRVRRRPELASWPFRSQWHDVSKSG